MTTERTDPGNVFAYAALDSIIESARLTRQELVAASRQLDKILALATEYEQVSSVDLLRILVGKDL